METTSDVEQSLPAQLRGPETLVTGIAGGLSGAAVYRVEARGGVYVLKVAGAQEDVGDWTRAIQIQRLAAAEGLAPRVVHVDESRRAVLTSFLEDRGFPGYYRDPGTHGAALDLLGRTVRRVHALPLPAAVPAREPRAVLAALWSRLQAGFAVPDFARDVIERALATVAPPASGPPVLSHNDLNPSNLLYDGRAIQILDWAAAGPMDRFYDPAVLAVFLRMDDADGLRLLSAYDGAPVSALPEGFVYHRRLAAALAGTLQLLLARQMSHPGATAGDTLEAALPLAELYRRLRTGALKMGTPEGQWAFGLSLLKENRTP